MISATGNISLRKQDLTDQKNIATGFVKTTFYHKATAGDTGINLSSLSMPAEMSANGASNPTTAQLTSANLLVYRKNLRLVSSLRGMLIDQLSYTVVSGTQINFIGFTAQAGEIFVGTIDYSAVTGIQVVSGTSLPAYATATASQTDFSLGYALPTNSYSTTRLGAVQVFANGALQLRNTGNSSTVTDGNYYEVDNGSGNFSVVRFNTGRTAGDKILLVPTGLIVPQPDGSLTTTVQTLAGQVNQMSQYVATLSGQTPSTVLGGAPSYTDLLAFGNSVNTINTNYASKNAINTFTQPQNIPGQTNGVAISAGNIGEFVTVNPTGINQASPVSGTYYDDATTLSLTRGVWLIYAGISMGIIGSSAPSGNTVAVGYGAIRTGSTVIAVGSASSALISGTPCFGLAGLVAQVNIGVTTVYKISIKWAPNSGTPTVSSLFEDSTNTYFYAVRIA